MGQLKVIIVGAGIGGLATAISIRRKSDHEVLVLDSAEEFGEVRRM